MDGRNRQTRPRSSVRIGEMENLLYYVLRKQLNEGESGDFKLARDKHIRDAGIHFVETPPYLDIAAQAIDLSQLKPELFDPRIQF